MHLLEMLYLSGYEIHMGESTWKEGAAASTFTKDTVTGKEKREGTFYHNVCGTYVHGIFDREEVALGLVKAVGDKKELMYLRWKVWILQRLRSHNMTSWRQN